VREAKKRVSRLGLFRDLTENLSNPFGRRHSMVKEAIVF